MENHYFRLDGYYAAEAGGRQITLWQCDDETGRSKCQQNEKLYPGDRIMVLDPYAVYAINSQGLAVKTK
ncbi:hypothetical protein [Flintibacter muris]|uniref:hypothetical protein n=1 Tax=Flintibacter muris TaxID=2941327 RepID=UPI00203A9EE9|nr:hypothetical protein [Flintibacter muris]